MRFSLKKMLAAVLAGLMLLSTTACGQTNDVDTTTKAQTDAATEDETKDPNYICDLPNDLDYHDEEVNILYVRDDEFISEAMGHGTIEDSIYERNLTVENQLGVKLSYVYHGDDPTTASFVRTTVQAGDRSLDIFAYGVYCCIDNITEGCYLDLSRLEHLNLSKYYWSQDFNNMMSFTSDNRQFVATSPAALSLFRLGYLTIFNRDLFRDRQIPDLYDAVDNGEWTLDYQYSLVKDVYVDSGDGQINEDDFYGFITGNCISVDGYFVASDIHLVIRDEYGDMIYNGDTLDRMVTLSEKVSALFNSPGTLVYQGVGGIAQIMPKFASGEGLMATVMFGDVESHISTLADVSYGVAPLPKMTREQADYHTYVQDSVTSFGISAAVADEDRQEMLGAVMEAIAYYSNEIVRPAYYDSALSLRFMQDPQSRFILDTMFETISFDYVFATGICGIRDSLRTILSDKNPAIASNVHKWQKNIKNQMLKLNKRLEEMDK